MQAKKAKRKARKAERKYDESMAYNKNLSPEARLHYLENERADKYGASMYGKGPNAFGAAEAVTIASTLAPYVKPVLSGIESLGAGERFSEGFSMKKKKSLKKDITEFGKTDIGKGLKQKGMNVLDKLIQETGKTFKGVNMTGKEKGPNLMGMGKKETKGALGGALAGTLMYGPLGTLAGGLAGKAFGKGRDRKEAEGASMMSDKKGPMMMGNSISKHMGGRGCNMYGDGPNAVGGKLLGGSTGAGAGAGAGAALGTLAAAPTLGLSIPVGAAIGALTGGAAGVGGGHLRDKMVEKRRNKRRAAKAGGANMKGKKPMMKGENPIVRDAKSDGKNQYNKYGK